MEKLTNMLIGSISTSYTAREKAKEHGIRHLVYPCFARIKELLKELVGLGKLVDNGKTKGKMYNLR